MTSFEKQIDASTQDPFNIEKIDFYGQEMEIVDYSPEVLSEETPIVIAPGWGETISSFKSTIVALNKKGRRVLSLNHPRFGNEMDDVDPEMKNYGPEVELRKALALLELINERVKDKADIVAHSEGGINTSIAATLQTEKFRNIVFTNSGGLMGPDSFVGLNNRFNLNLVTEAVELLATKDPEKESRLRTHILSNLKYIAQNPIRATKEAVAISSTQIDGVLDYLHGEGVGIIVLCADSDKIFPTEKVKELLKDKKVDKMVIMPGGHNELGTDPDNYVDAITKAISEVNHIAQ